MDSFGHYSEFAEDKLIFQHINAGDDHSANTLLKKLHGRPAIFAGKVYLRDWTDKAEEIPDAELRFIRLGWDKYYSANYLDAAKNFIEAIEVGNVWLSWSCLGLGKVLSDLGRWLESRNWLLASLKYSREQNDYYRMAECYGSLGEVFFRTGNYQVALEMFSLDKQILPPGSSFRYRLENYMAITSGRLGAYEIATQALWQSYFGALNSNPTSSWYSLASLFTLSVFRTDSNLFDRLSMVSPPSDCPYIDMPKAFIEVAKAYWHLKESDSSQAGNCLEKAASFFSSRYPVETLWVRTLMCRFVSKNHSPYSTAPWIDNDFVINISPLSPGLVDRRLAEIPIQNQTFFQFGDMASCEDPFEKWKYFLV